LWYMLWTKRYQIKRTDKNSKNIYNRPLQIALITVSAKCCCNMKNTSKNV
jgi:hypothetical protein